MVKCESSCPLAFAFCNLASAIELNVHKRNNATARNLMRAMTTYQTVLYATQYYVMEAKTRTYNVHA